MSSQPLFSGKHRHLQAATGYIGRPMPVLIGIEMKKLLLWSAILLFFGEIATSSAALGQKTYAIALGGGAAIPVGKLGDVQNTGYNAIAALALGIADLPMGIRFDGIYNNLSHPKTPAGGTATSDLRVAGALANFVFAFPGTSSKAYLIAGFGWYNSKSDVPGAKSQSNWGSNGGVGATFAFGPVATFVEARYHSVSRSASKGGVYQFVPITFGIMF